MARKVEMLGRRFGRLTVLRESPVREGTGEVRYECRCDCGTVLTVRGANLRRGATRSCGCLARNPIRAGEVWYDGWLSTVLPLFEEIASSGKAVRWWTPPSLSDYGVLRVEIGDEVQDVSVGTLCRVADGRLVTRATYPYGRVSGRLPMEDEEDGTGGQDIERQGRRERRASAVEDGA